jgi:hypothetical protein
VICSAALRGIIFFLDVDEEVGFVGEEEEKDNDDCCCCCS